MQIPAKSALGAREPWNLHVMCPLGPGNVPRSSRDAPCSLRLLTAFFTSCKTAKQRWPVFLHTNIKNENKQQATGPDVRLMWDFHKDPESCKWLSHLDIPVTSSRGQQMALSPGRSEKWGIYGEGRIQFWNTTRRSSAPSWDRPRPVLLSNTSEYAQRFWNFNSWLWPC